MCQASNKLRSNLRHTVGACQLQLQDISTLVCVSVLASRDCLAWLCCSVSGVKELMRGSRSRGTRVWWCAMVLRVCNWACLWRQRWSVHSALAELAGVLHVRSQKRCAQLTSGKLSLVPANW